MSKCWYCNNELTSGDNPKHFGICNKCYDEMFKSGDVIICSLTNKITELKQQLAEKEKEIERWHNNYKQRDRQFQSVRQRYHLLNRLQAKYHDKHKLHLSEMQCLELVEENEKLQQDKISFWIEQLEKVKEFFLEEHRDEEMDTDYIITKDAGEIADYILDQIKQLNEGK